MEIRSQASTLGASAVFQVVPGIPTITLADQLPRRERWVFLLVDGKRTVTTWRVSPSAVNSISPLPLPGSFNGATLSR